LQAG